MRMTLWLVPFLLHLGTAGSFAQEAYTHSEKKTGAKPVRLSKQRQALTSGVEGMMGSERSRLPLASFQSFPDTAAQQWISIYGSQSLPSSGGVQDVAVDSRGNVYVTGGISDSLTSGDCFTIKYNTVGVQQWAARYDASGGHGSTGGKIAIDQVGNVYVAGRISYVTGEDPNDFLVIKYDSSGIQQWLDLYDGPEQNSQDLLWGLAVDSSGNVYVTGQSGAVLSTCDYATIKYNSAGVRQWVARYNGPVGSGDEGNAICVDGTGGVYVTGRSYSGQAARYDVATVMYNASGVQQWVARYNNSRDDAAYAIAIDRTGNVVVTGETWTSAFDSDYLTLKYNSSGVQQWVAQYNGPAGSGSYDRATAIGVDTLGNVYVTGYSPGSGTDNDFATIKYNSAGVQQWAARFNGTANLSDQARDIVVDGSGHCRVTGNSVSGSSEAEIMTIMYDSAGVQQWAVSHNGNVGALCVDLNHNVYVAGSTRNANAGYDLCTIKYSASGVQQWLVTLSGPGRSNDGTTLMTLDRNGNVYVAGWSEGGSGMGLDRDYITIKYNALGVRQWVARYNGPGFQLGFDNVKAIAVDTLGNVYVTGESIGDSASGGQYDYATVKYNSSGVEQWVARYNGPAQRQDRPTGLVVDGSGNVYVTGMSEVAEYVGDYVTIKYSPTGVQQWLARYNGPGDAHDAANAIAIDADANIYVTGESWSTGMWTSGDCTTIKYNSAGAQQWVARYNGPGDYTDFGTAIALDDSSNVYVTGSSYLGTVTDCLTVKYNSAGVQQWVSTYDGPSNSNDAATAIAVDGLGSVYVTGYSDGIDYDDFATIKYNSAGVQQWVAIYNGPGNNSDRAFALALDASSNVYITGPSYGVGTWSDYATLKYNSSGIVQWVARYHRFWLSEDWTRAIAVDSAGNVYVTGESRDFMNCFGVTIKYSQIGTSVVLEQVSLPTEFALFQNYPNPFNPSTIIRYQIPVKSLITLKVYDILGREVAMLVNAEREPGSYEVEWDARDMSSGVYFYQLTAGSFVDVKKLIILK